MTLVWESEGIVHCILEHHQGYLYLFTDAAKDGHVVDSHYLLCSPVDCPSNPRIWEVGELIMTSFVSFLFFLWLVNAFSSFVYMSFAPRLIDTCSYLSTVHALL